jgi:ribosomal protein S18 acetylase RimI-like enzyme
VDSQLTDQTSAMPAIALRPVGPDDEAFLLALYASTRAAEMAMVPWSDEQREAFVKMQFAGQQAHYKKTYPAASHQILLSNGRAVGGLYVARLADEIRIIDLTVMPGERNSGIGTLALEELIAEGKQVGKVVRIYVENYSSSLSLFERLNFKPIEQQGFYLLLERTPDAG